MPFCPPRKLAALPGVPATLWVVGARVYRCQPLMPKNVKHIVGPFLVCSAIGTPSPVAYLVQRFQCLSTVLTFRRPCNDKIDVCRRLLPAGGESIPGHLRWHSRVLGLIGGQREASGPRRFCRSTALPAGFCPEGSLIASLTRCMALPNFFRSSTVFYFMG